MFKRNCIKTVLEALKDTPVILICGARQVGKSTLVKQIIGYMNDINYFTLNDASTLSLASSSPTCYSALVLFLNPTMIQSQL